MNVLNHGFTCFKWIVASRQLPGQGPHLSLSSVTALSNQFFNPLYGYGRQNLNQPAIAESFQFSMVDPPIKWSWASSLGFSQVLLRIKVLDGFPAFATFSSSPLLAPSPLLALSPLFATLPFREAERNLLVFIASYATGTAAGAQLGNSDEKENILRAFGDLVAVSTSSDR
jgi:hypothetical protein